MISLLSFFVCLFWSLYFCCWSKQIKSNQKIEGQKTSSDSLPHKETPSAGAKRGAVPLPVEQVDVDLYGLVNETCLQQSGLGLLDLTTEQQHVSQRRLPGRLLLDEVDVLHPRQLVDRRQRRPWGETTQRWSKLSKKMSHIIEIRHILICSGSHTCKTSCIFLLNHGQPCFITSLPFRGGKKTWHTRKTNNSKVIEYTFFQSTLRPIRIHHDQDKGNAGC